MIGEYRRHDCAASAYGIGPWPSAPLTCRPRSPKAFLSNSLDSKTCSQRYRSDWNGCFLRATAAGPLPAQGSCIPPPSPGCGGLVQPANRRSRNALIPAPPGVGACLGRFDRTLMFRLATSPCPEACLQAFWLDAAWA